MNLKDYQESEIVRIKKWAEQSIKDAYETGFECAKNRAVNIACTILIGEEIEERIINGIEHLILQMKTGE